MGARTPRRLACGWRGIIDYYRCSVCAIIPCTFSLLIVPSDRSSPSHRPGVLKRPLHDLPSREGCIDD
ncbi:hypothetical protein BDY19DRAFT_977618 [Irpex rosettiformis]|uniref:Uncharacterized protein n=1 Tax=Irpex rosettiformis TaxID=378272 RepID=A0ACB8TNG8_9APHY|nr:hypothetical protein BDY19DRAFT_977618 [Irpex rosettiformis]